MPARSQAVAHTTRGSRRTRLQRRTAPMARGRRRRKGGIDVELARAKRAGSRSDGSWSPAWIVEAYTSARDDATDGDAYPHGARAPTAACSTHRDLTRGRRVHVSRVRRDDRRDASARRPDRRRDAASDGHPNGQLPRVRPRRRSSRSTASTQPGRRRDRRSVARRRRDRDERQQRRRVRRLQRARRALTPATSARRSRAPARSATSTTPRSSRWRRRDAADGGDHVAVLRHQLAARLLVRRRLHRGGRQRAERRTTAAAASRATRSSPRRRTTRSAARATTRTCRRPPTACRRACRCILWTRQGRSRYARRRRTHAADRHAPRSVRRTSTSPATLVVGTTARREPDRWLHGAAPNDGRPARSSLVDRGNCTFKTKALNVQNAGGVGMILVNNVASTSPPRHGRRRDDHDADHDRRAVGHAGRRRAAQGRASRRARSPRRCIASSAPSSTARSTRR